MNFEERIRLYESHFTDLEDDICDYIVKHRHQISEIKLVELAKEFYTVPNTITRLCHKMHYSGYLELKKAIIDESETTNQDSEDDYISFIKRNIDLIEHEDYRDLVQLFKKSKQVIIFAVGSTEFVAKLFVDTLNAVENKFYFIEYEHELRKQISNTNEKKTILFISLTGETEPGLQLAKDAVSLDHKVVSLTNFTKNSLSQVSDIDIYCISPERRFDGSNVTDKLPLLIVLDTLFKHYSESR